MPSLTKADLSEHLNDVVGLNKREAKEMVEILFEELSVSLIDGDPVRLSGFGNFELRDKNERPGRNPKTGEKVPVERSPGCNVSGGTKLRSQVELYHPLDSE